MVSRDDRRKRLPHRKWLLLFVAALVLTAIESRIGHPKYALTFLDRIGK